MAVNTNYNDQSNTSPVDQILKDWAKVEDQNLAEKIHFEEIKSHLSENKRKNIQIREDFPKALLEQEHEFQLQLEEACACDMLDPTPKVKYNDNEYKVELARPAMIQDDEPIYENTSRGAASSRKAEEILKQEQEDEKLAKRLQSSENSFDETKDYKYALRLQEKERAKIARAKERSRIKKLVLENAKAQNTATIAEVPAPITTTEPLDIVIAPESQSAENESKDTTNEPQKQELSESQKHLLEKYKQRLDQYDDIVPPYMPMQCQSGKKSLALEDKLKKRKEKEGCSQQ
ncbi:unnamed protein product [Lepeophtheirus salmonis]|uniref:(salmon louse) hypothetical protein n=1 Tax=Lepeophtheirus salmonis TaxID=72036 RepID=A0A7R8GYM9_LEPSM|nr:unnamed protein product [Lepeophtheirus salmonis]CAF2749905.1 unnamed protein product [Lepeophtheirus salmonis]